MIGCEFHEDQLATHEVAMRPPNHADDWCQDYWPVCEGCAAEYDDAYVRPMRFHECEQCRREIDVEWPGNPLCQRCAKALRAGGRSEQRVIEAAKEATHA